ncbi:MAG: hypothetical protein BEN18_04010 [Epulopiscium sp. Nuni2H_MBin001]|nr:MAG: hypothetical protein BEN18_04010 [Epulopiscium sp. Nuni2H_MBin001]
MEYRKIAKEGAEVSLLGYGCMRFPTKGRGIDKELAFSQMKLAFDNGVNYYDTAYPYHAGKSEVILGEFIKKYNIRDKIFIADKLPTFLVTKAEQINKYFDTQLKRLDTTYIDYYLMHMLTSISDWEKLKSLGILEFIDKKKKNGQIKHIGFSFHGKPDEFIKILEDYPWEFCQIQYNYLDENNQAGKAGLKRAEALGIGVVVMEPLRGGSLAAKAPDKVKEIFKSYKQQRSAAYWGLRFVMNHQGVGTVLSGMNVIEHIKDNIDVASHTSINSMSKEEHDIINQVKKVYADLMKVPCTGCNYCMPCPFGVDIPTTFSEYNSIYFFNSPLFYKFQYMARAEGMVGGGKAGADLCVNCKKCMKHCPQDIAIPTKLSEAHKNLNNKPIRAVLKIGAKVMNRKKKS